MKLQEKYKHACSVVERKSFPELLKIIGDKRVKCEMWLDCGDGCGRKYWAAAMIRFVPEGNGCRMDVEGFNDFFFIGDVSKVVNENMTGEYSSIGHIARMSTSGLEAKVKYNEKDLVVFGIMFNVRQLFDEFLKVEL